MTMKHLDLFSGIGGFALAAQWMGWETVAFCEKEKYAKRVLERHWPNVPIIDDIRDIKEPIGCDILTGGFPCQPFSSAGKQKGKADDRYLWPEMLRVIALERPAWVVGENVAGLIGMALDTVLFDLENQGYSGRAFVIPAAGVDAPHRRDRVWIIARDISDPKSQRLQGVQSPTSNEKSCKPRPQSQPSGICGGKAMAHSQGERLQRNTQTQVSRQSNISQQPWGSSKDKLPRWPAEPGVCRVVNGLPNRAHRIKALGNAVVPQVVYQIFKAIDKQ